jgi:hypothetical protein
VTGLIIGYLLGAIATTLYAKYNISLSRSRPMWTSVAILVGLLWILIVPCLALVIGLEEFNEWRDYRRYVRDSKRNRG